MQAQPHAVLHKVASDIALQDAMSWCGKRGARMTMLRCAVLEMLWRSDRPLGAYDLLSRLQAKLGRKLAPPTIYRALEFLSEHRLIARLESLNAYVPCANPESPYERLFFVCDQCRTSVEIANPALETLVNKNALSLGFQIARRIMELQGTCAACQSTQPSAVPNGSSKT
jgi:Fur family zinc uptake transcriptional regulator